MSARNPAAVVREQLRDKADNAEKSLPFLDEEFVEETNEEISLWRTAADLLDGSHPLTRIRELEAINAQMTRSRDEQAARAGRLEDALQRIAALDGEWPAEWCEIAREALAAGGDT